MRDINLSNLVYIHRYKIAKKSHHWYARNLKYSLRTKNATSHRSESSFFFFIRRLALISTQRVETNFPCHCPVKWNIKWDETRTVVHTVEIRRRCYLTCIFIVASSEDIFLDDTSVLGWLIFSSFEFISRHPAESLQLIKTQSVP